MSNNTNYFAMIDDENEFEMWQGLRGPYFQPHVAEDGTLSWTNNGGLTNPDPIRIEGHDGAPGFSPTVEIQTIQGGHRVIITDEDGPHSFDVIDYMEGRAIQSTVLNADYTLTIRYTDGTSYTTPSIRGATGATGPAGADGTNGTDGVSPDVTITSITGGHRVTITDADHPQGQSFDVMDGSSQGGLPAGGSTMDFLAKSSNTDYDAQWVSLYSSSTPAMDGTGSAGITSTFSRSDHVHPTDTNKQDKILVSGLLKGNGSGGVSAAVAGTDYLTRGTNYSPVQKVPRNQTYALTVADVGKTFWEQWSTNPNLTRVEFSLTQANSVSIPVGAEFAFTYIYATAGTITFSGVRVEHDVLGEFATADNTVTVSFARRSLVALKKLETAASVGDVWILTGNVEVVT